jgi:hypothetical protein
MSARIPTELSKKGELDPVIGRNNEIERVIQILCRRTKNNPVLLGEAGVGKTAIVEGLAQEIAAGKLKGRCGPLVMGLKGKQANSLVLTETATRSRFLLHSFAIDPVSRLLRPLKRFNAELLGVLCVQLRPAELHCLAANDAADGLSMEKPIQNIETNVPPGSTHGDEPAIDVVPQCQARAASKTFQFPTEVLPAPVVLKQLRSIGSCHDGLGNLLRGRSYCGEFYFGSNVAQIAIGLKGRPLAQLRRVGQCLPDFLRRVAQFSDQNERPLRSVLPYLRPAGGTRFVRVAIFHLFFLVFLVFIFG